MKNVAACPGSHRTSNPHVKQRQKHRDVILHGFSSVLNLCKPVAQRRVVHFPPAMFLVLVGIFVLVFMHEYLVPLICRRWKTMPEEASVFWYC